MKSPAAWITLATSALREALALARTPESKRARARRLDGRAARLESRGKADEGPRGRRLVDRAADLRARAILLRREADLLER